MAKARRYSKRELARIERDVERYAAGLAGSIAGGARKAASALAGLLGLGSRPSRRRPTETPDFSQIGQALMEPPAPPIQPPLPPGGGGFRSGSTREPPRPGESQNLSEEILSPQSSNVFSFQYHFRTSTLYVTFKAAVLNKKSVEGGSGRRGGKSQLRGKLGSTVTGQRKNDRGAMYAYLDVPARVFQRMQLAASKGKFVWDELRIRGTVFGHRYRYQLVQGQVTPDVGGVYIPRKATKNGFRVRSVADLGSGRRGFQSSTLPEQQGFSSRANRSRRGR